MKAAITGILLLLCSFSLFAQTGYSIKGTVVDTATKAKLVNALITVLNSKDSTLVKFGRAAADGSYSINNLTKGKFILLATYPAYADYVEKFELDSVNRIHVFNQINLTLKARLLEEIVINGTAAISIKGDTTVFSTSNLKIQPNSNVEDLLKQLPGIQVDQNGKITAQGQAVNKVLVDGEEFFGDDPTLVTKNIRGDMVKNVQLYDKKSDQAAFTGIDDGVKTKTLNIQLKDGSKNGYFGKVDAGQTTDSYYQGQGMFNQFKAKKKFAAYGTVGNTGKTGLGFEDSGKYGVGNSNVQIMDGGIYISGGGDELESFNGRYDGRGIPFARSGGAHFDSKWNKDKESINTNYKIGSLSVDGNQNTLTQNNLPSGVINTNADQDYNKYIFRQKLDATYEVKFNVNSTLKISTDGTLKNTENNSQNLTFNQRGDNTKLNKSDRTLSNDADQKIMNASAFWTQKLKKTGRTFSLNISEAFNTNDAKGFLNSTNEFYNTTGQLDSTQQVDQYKTNTGKSSVLASNMTWSEPFSKTFSLILNYGLTLRNETAEKLSFNQSVPGKYDLLDQQFSNNFQLEQTSNLAGAIFNYTKKKTVLNFGTRMSAVSYNQTDL
ncbi:MAG TPA: TonB-dependent receptor, partial [Sphingobacteriaceae bacterium]|nr:TonB-dependent receptor [Sphingobacteriaceae bacterium]